ANSSSRIGVGTRGEGCEAPDDVSVDHAVADGVCSRMGVASHLVREVVGAFLERELARNRDARAIRATRAASEAGGTTFAAVRRATVDESLRCSAVLHLGVVVAGSVD